MFDYDKNRQFRFLLAAPNGEVFNFRKEGERTPGWKFKAESGRHIVRLSHLRIGPRDYIGGAGRWLCPHPEPDGGGSVPFSGARPSRAAVGRLGKDLAFPRCCTWTMKGGCKSERLDRMSRLG